MSLFPEDIEAEAEAIKATRARLKIEQEALDRRTRDLVLRLRPRVVARRVAALVGISPARVSQIELGQ